MAGAAGAGETTLGCGALSAGFVGIVISFWQAGQVVLLSLVSLIDAQRISAIRALEIVFRHSFLLIGGPSSSMMLMQIYGAF